MTNVELLNCRLDNGACLLHIILSEDIRAPRPLHLDIQEHVWCFLCQLKHLIKSWDYLSLTKVKSLQLLTRQLESKFIWLSIFSELSIIPSMQDHWYTVCAYPNIKLDAINSMLNCEFEIFHTVFWTKISPSVSHYDCPFVINLSYILTSFVDSQELTICFFVVSIAILGLVYTSVVV